MRILLSLDFLYLGHPCVSLRSLKQEGRANSPCSQPKGHSLSSPWLSNSGPHCLSAPDLSSLIRIQALIFPGLPPPPFPTAHPALSPFGYEKRAFGVGICVVSYAHYQCCYNPLGSWPPSPSAVGLALCGWGLRRTPEGENAALSSPFPCVTSVMQSILSLGG